MSRTIKPENWQVLSESIREALQHECDSFIPLAVAAFRRGDPEADFVEGVADRLRLIANRTYNGAQRRQCLAVLDTLSNYGLT